MKQEEKPSELIQTWDNKDKAQAIKIVLMHDIPVRNLYIEADRKFIEEFVERDK